ncbi:hypothetical protein GCM10027444_17550 [Actinopolyspora lacussalsi]
MPPVSRGSGRQAASGPVPGSSISKSPNSVSIQPVPRANTGSELSAYSRCRVRARSGWTLSVKWASTKWLPAASVRR